LTYQGATLILVPVTEGNIDDRLSSFRLKGGDESSTEASGPEVSPSISVSPRTRRARGTSNVIAVRLQDNGSIDTEHMRGETLKRLTTAITKSNLGTPAEDVSIAYALLVPAIYKVLGSLEAVLASKALKVSRADAAEVFEYTQDEIAVLTEPTANVLNKYSGTWLPSHSDEVTLCLHLYAIHQVKLEALRERYATKKQESPTQKVVSIT